MVFMLVRIDHISMRGIKVDLGLLWKSIDLVLVWLVEIVLFKFRALAIN